MDKLQFEKDLTAFAQSASQIQASAIKMAIIIFPACQKLARQFAAVPEILHRNCWKAYRQAGCPYGETEEAMIRWIQEAAQADPSKRKNHNS